MKIVSLIFLSPPRERIEVRGNDPRTFFHPHPDPLPSREREIKERVTDRSVSSKSPFFKGG
jgi:hypothetical protein